jgi:hypothetical protein
MLTAQRSRAHHENSENNVLNAACQNTIFILSFVSAWVLSRVLRMLAVCFGGMKFAVL